MDQYKEGENIDTDLLVVQADNKFKTMFEAKTWNAPSLEEEKILTLETQIDKLQNKKKKPKQANKKGGKRRIQEGKNKKKKDLSKWMKIPLAEADKDKPKTIRARSTFGVPSMPDGVGTPPWNAKEWV